MPELLEKLRENKTALLERLQSASADFSPSFAQRRFFTLQKLNPADGFYNVPFAFRLSGDLDVAVLRASFNEIVKRHEVLRTTLEERGGELVQVIAPEEIHLTIAGSSTGPRGIVCRRKPSGLSISLASRACAVLLLRNARRILSSTLPCIIRSSIRVR